MDLRSALKQQYHSALAMLGECIEVCPDDLWISGTFPRAYWRIAFHAAFFTQLYLGQDEAAFQPWPGRREGVHGLLWVDPAQMEPYELPEDAEVYSQQELREYVRFVDSQVDPIVDRLNLETEESGFRWYKNISKLSHELMNLRHIQGHVGQLSELLMARGIDIDWKS
jgi:hypothetical protein